MKPSIEPTTGCAHITNECCASGFYRACSACHAGIPDHESGPGFGSYIDEENVDHCYRCGATFDHTDDDEPMEEE